MDFQRLFLPHVPGRLLRPWVVCIWECRAAIYGGNVRPNGCWCYEGHCRLEEMGNTWQVIFWKLNAAGGVGKIGEVPVQMSVSIVRTCSNELGPHRNKCLSICSSRYFPNLHAESLLASMLKVKFLGFNLHYCPCKLPKFGTFAFPCFPNQSLFSFRARTSLSGTFQMKVSFHILFLPNIWTLIE